MSWCDDHGSGSNRTPDDYGTACADAACPIHTASAYDGARFHRAQGDEAPYQQ